MREGSAVHSAVERSALGIVSAPNPSRAALKVTERFHAAADELLASGTVEDAVLGLALLATLDDILRGAVALQVAASDRPPN